MISNKRDIIKLMSEQADRLLSLLLPYGLSADEASLYLNLWENGSSSALILSRRLDLARTKAYRILDKLEKLGLVIVRLHERGKRFEAANPKQLAVITEDREQEVKKLKSNFPILEEQLGKLAFRGGEKSKVLYYEGIEGLKQVTWNSLKAKGELLTLEIKDLDAFFDHETAENLRERFVERQVKIRTLTNMTYISKWTDVSQAAVKEYWEIRHIPKEQMKIKFEILIYNDVYTMYRYLGKEIFCVEIYNRELAEMQRQLFEYMWLKARKFKVLNDRGEAKLL